jgi:Xaa-Pro dipeptidase
MAFEENDPHDLAENMSFTVEPNVSLPKEEFGYKMGDTVLCTASGSECLSELDHELIIID